MRIFETMKWLVNHPPTSLEKDTEPDRNCDYCPSKNGLWSIRDIYSICHDCQKRVYDNVLKKTKRK